MASADGPRTLQAAYHDEVTAQTPLQKQQRQSKKNVDRALEEKRDVLLQLQQTKAVQEQLMKYCKTLQQHTKALEEECKKREEEDEQTSKALEEKFGAMMADIATKIDGQISEKDKMAESNEQLKQKVDELQVEVDKQSAEFAQTLTEVEAALETAKTNLAEKQIFRQTKETAVMTLLRQAEVYGSQEKEMIQQIELYDARFGQCTDTLEKSRLAFETFTGEVERLKGVAQVLEDDNRRLTTSIDEANTSLKDIAKRKITRRKETEAIESEKTKLQAEAKRLQQLRDKLQKERGVTPQAPPPTPTPAPAPVVEASF